MILDHPEATGLRSIEEMTESAYKSFILDESIIKPAIKPNDININNIMIIIRRNDFTNLPNQLLPPTYRGNGYIDVVKAGAMERDSLFGISCLGFLTPHVIEIDTPDDWEYAEWWCTHGGIGSFNG